MSWPQAKDGWLPPEARRGLERMLPHSSQETLTLQTPSSQTLASRTARGHISVAFRPPQFVVLVTAAPGHWLPLQLGCGAWPSSVQTLHL